VHWQRIADVNLNRLSESLKFIEDYVRFSTVRNNLLVRIRRIRTQYQSIKKELPITELAVYRDSEHDAGRPLAFDRTGHRTIQELLIANFSRAKESSRILEELLKLIGKRLSGAVKKLRFQLYDFEKEFFTTLCRPFDPRLHAILDEKYIASMNRAHVAHCVKILKGHGATMIQLRMEKATDAKFLSCAKFIRKLLLGSQLAFIINNRCDIAMAAGADGVHVGHDDIPVAAVRAIAGPRFIIGASARTVAEARRAERAGADYLGVGALFPTRTKPEARPCSIKMLRRICRSVTIPVIGIGGINNKNYRAVLKAGADGIAAASYLHAGDMKRALRSLTKDEI
jgi:thiamine-phosphate pyrophosphorylase